MTAALDRYKHFLFDWGDTLMVDYPDEEGPMFKWPKVAVVEGAFELLYILSRRAECHVATNAEDSSQILPSRPKRSARSEKT